MVCATDLSSRCDRAMDRAAQLARGWHARLVVVHALESSPELVAARRLRELPSWRRPADRAQLVAEQPREDLGDQAGEVAIVVEEAEPAALVKQASDGHRAGLIVTGVARNERLGRQLLGTTVDALIRQVTTPVLIVRARPRRPYARIVAATDFSSASRHAMEAVAALFPDADLTLFHAFRPITGGIADGDRVRDSWRALAAQNMATFLAGATLPDSLRTRLGIVVEEGNPEPLLGDFVVATRADLVVAGTRGQNGDLDLILGNTAKRPIEGMSCDVLAVRAPR
ncbi:MAG: universal stress protein [Geminicoccaceae bacterium]